MVQKHVQQSKKHEFNVLKNLDTQIERGSNDANLEMALATTRLGKKVLEGENLSKSFGERVIIKRF